MGAAWHSAVVFAVGNAVCGLVISAVTDLAGRVAFLGELRRRAVMGAGGQGQQLPGCVSCRVGVVESSTWLERGIKA